MRFPQEKEKEAIYIWGESIPGNTGKSKNDIMHWDESLSFADIVAKYPGVWDRESDRLGDMRGNDTMAYNDEIKNGYAEETYSDRPFLMPFTVPGSEMAVIICPGGAYLNKSIDTEGEDIAAFLNEAGISCFVLWYRSYPYKAPYMFLDLQRAVRYLRFHAADYGFSPDKIVTLGFSAGGNLAAVQATIIRNSEISFPDYAPDEVDKTDGNPNAVGLIYPAVSFKGDKIQAVLFGREAYDDPELRKSFGEKYEAKNFVREGDAPYFICNAVDDEVIDAFLAAEFAAELRNKGVGVELHMFSYGGHGFGACLPEHVHLIPGMEMPDLSAVVQWKELFVNWLGKVFE